MFIIVKVNLYEQLGVVNYYFYKKFCFFKNNLLLL